MVSLDRCATSVITPDVDPLHGPEPGVSKNQATLGMQTFWQRIEHGTIKPWLRRMRPYREATYSGVRVSYKSHLDGGGSTTMFLDGKVVNTPSDKEGERKVSDAIVVTLRKNARR